MPVKLLPRRAKRSQLFFTILLVAKIAQCTPRDHRCPSCRRTTFVVGCLMMTLLRRLQFDVVAQLICGLIRRMTELSEGTSVALSARYKALLKQATRKTVTRSRLV